MDQNIKREMCAYFLHNIAGVGNRSILKLLEHGGTPEMVYAMSENELLPILRSKAMVDAFLTARSTWDIEKEYKKMNERQVKFYSVFHPLYPVRLKEIPDPPFGIYVKGSLPEDKRPAIAIIGARNCSEYGKHMARKFGDYLGSAGIPVVSGLARGIDGIAQKAVLESGGKTFGILGSGVDICYPEEHQGLFTRIPEQGGLISEYPEGTLPRPGHFPVRNRIISGLSDIILVIEAKEKSGTLITVDMALEQGKEVFALPGRVTDQVSQGCNHLIRQGAGIAISPEQILEELSHYQKEEYRTVDNLQDGAKSSNNDLDGENKRNTETMMWNFTEEEKILYEVLELTPKSVEQIFAECRDKGELVDIQSTMNSLVCMLMKGAIANKGMNYFFRKSV